MKYKVEATGMSEYPNVRVFDIETGEPLTSVQIAKALNQLEALRGEIETVKEQCNNLRESARKIFNLFDDVKNEFDGSEHQQGKKDGLRLAISYLYPSSDWNRFNTGERYGRRPGRLSGVAKIARERSRQINEEGWTAEHDDGWVGGELVLAAIAYAWASTSLGKAKRVWPWLVQWFKPASPMRNLAKAGALIAAEIDRLQRKEGD